MSQYIHIPSKRIFSDDYAAYKAIYRQSGKALVPGVLLIFGLGEFLKLESSTTQRRRISRISTTIVNPNMG